MHAHGVPIALATSSHQRHYAVKTQRHTALFSLFNHRITGVLTLAETQTSFCQLRVIPFRHAAGPEALHA